MLRSSVRGSARSSVRSTLGAGGGLLSRIQALFDGASGFMFKAGNPSIFVMYQDAAATTPVDAVTQSVGKIIDLSPSGIDATQSTSNSRPTLQQPSGYAFRYDGLDDYMITTLNPQSSGALIFGGTMNAAGDLALGSNGGASDRFYIGTNPSGYLGAGVSADNYLVIQGSTDITGVDGFNAVRWNGSTVLLNRDDPNNPIYNAAQKGAPSTPQPVYLGCYNNLGTAQLFADADIDFFFAIMGRELSNNDLALIKSYRDL